MPRYDDRTMRSSAQSSRAAAGRRGLLRCLLLIGMLVICHAALSSAPADTTGDADGVLSVSAPLATDTVHDGAGAGDTGTGSLLEECALLVACALGAIGLGALFLRRGRRIVRVLWLAEPRSGRTEGVAVSRPFVGVQRRLPVVLVC